MKRLPDLCHLFERHPGFYEPLCRAYADAAAITFNRHHSSPLSLRITKDDVDRTRRVTWDLPSTTASASWGNSDDAVRDGAYSVAIATVESEMGYYAIFRAERRTGADYYVGPEGSDLESAFRLEVSGTELGDGEVESRYKKKIQQLREGKSDLPGFACVVGFRAKRVIIGPVESH